MTRVRTVAPFLLPGTLGVALTLSLNPPTPSTHLGVGAGCAGGAALGGLLFLAQQRNPRPPVAPIGLVAVVVLGVLALAEELLWRRFVLGECLRLGIPAAIFLSTVGFAILHRRPTLHLVTGGIFSVAYVVSGQFIAPVAAHWVYNAAIATTVLTARRAKPV